MENKISYIEPLLDQAEEYGKTTYELAKLKAVDKATDVVSMFISHGTIVMFISIFLLFISLGTALWLGNLLSNLYYGFFCVAAFYGIVGGVLFLARHPIQRCIGDRVVLKILS